MIVIKAGVIDAIRKYWPFYLPFWLFLIYFYLFGTFFLGELNLTVFLLFFGVPFLITFFLSRKPKTSLKTRLLIDTISAAIWIMCVLIGLIIKGT
jgi:hypothetical protein